MTARKKLIGSTGGKRIPGKRAASAPSKEAEPLGIYQRAGHKDTSRQVFGECPHCTEVVVIFTSGKVEPHRELCHVKGRPVLGGPCPGSNKPIVALVGAA